MIFQEPKVEFVALDMNESVIATSGPAYAICEREGVAGLDQQNFCAEMGVAGMPFDD